MYSSFYYLHLLIMFLMYLVQPVLEKIRLEMVIRIQNEILDGHHRGPA